MSGLLITRPLAQAAGTAARLKAVGYEVFLAPLLEIQPLLWSLPDIAPQAVLLTSANAVPALAQTPFSRVIPVYAVGAKTADEARAAGFTQVASADGDAQALAALVRQRCGQGLGALLHLAGEVVAGDLPAQLAADGFWVETRHVYRAVAATVLPPDVQQALGAGRIGTVLLYSPRSAAVFARLVDANWRAKLQLVCLSKAIGKAAGQGWARVTISPQADEDSLLETLLAKSEYGVGGKA